MRDRTGTKASGRGAPDKFDPEQCGRKVRLAGWVEIDPKKIQAELAAGGNWHMRNYNAAKAGPEGAVVRLAGSIDSRDTAPHTFKPLKYPKRHRPK